MGFRENLKNELTYQDIKVKELAERTGISKHTLDHYLAANGSQPQAELAVKIARALNVSVESLILGKDSVTFTRSSEERLSVLKKIERLSDEDFNFIKRIVEKL